MRGKIVGLAECCAAISMFSAIFGLITLGTLTLFDATSIDAVIPFFKQLTVWSLLAFAMSVIIGHITSEWA